VTRFNRRGLLAASLAGIAAAPLRASEPALALHKRLAPLSRFLGSWHGVGEGKSGISSLERTYEPVLAGRFLLCRSRSTYVPQPENPKGEVHEEMGLFSFDASRNRFVLRQFHVEGFVNEYVSSTDGVVDDGLVFETEAIENIPVGWRARETYRFFFGDAFEEVFELSEPGKPFEIYTHNRLRRT
jgi:hypothetical protein